MPETLRRVRQFLWGLAGARGEILAQSPTEQVKFESLGWSLLVTSGMAVVSMWFALSTAMGINGIFAVFPALFWGLVIMGIDRWLITSMPLEGRRKLGIAAPRVLMAVLLGSLISTPFVLRIFESEINAQISVIKEQRYNQFLSEQQKSNVGAQVTYWTNQVASLQKVIDSAGAVPLDPAADPDVKALTVQRDKEIQLEQGYFKTWQCQLYGVYQSVKCPKGNGPLAKASEDSYNKAKARVTELDNEISARESQLAATDATSEKTRFDQAKSALPYAQGQLQVARQRQDLLRTAFANQNTALNGILVRLQALSQLSHDDFTVTAARWLLFLLFLVIECLPVTVKLLQQPGPYEKILKKSQEADLSAARRRGYRTGPGFGMEPAGTGPVVRLQAEPVQDVRAIWRQTLALPSPLGDPADEEDTEVLGRRHRDPDHWDQERPRDDRVPGADVYRGDDGLRADTRPDDARQGGARRGDDFPDVSREDSLPLDETRRDRVPQSPRSRPAQDSPVMTSGGLHLTDRRLRDMSGDRMASDSDGHSGVPLNWDED